MKEIFGVVKRGDRNYWTRIGCAFENAADGSWNLLFDFLPTDPATTIQLRDRKSTRTEALDEGTPPFGAEA
jgi:hypothetical protein